MSYFPYSPGSEGFTCPTCKKKVLKPPINHTTYCECGLSEITHQGTLQVGTCDLFMNIPEEGHRWKFSYWERTEADMLEYERKEKEYANAEQAERQAKKDANAKNLRNWAAWEYLNKINKNSK